MVLVLPSFRGGDGKGWRCGGKTSFLSVRSKEFKRCSSLSVLLGGRSLDRDQSHGLAMGSHTDPETGASSAQVLEHC